MDNEHTYKGKIIHKDGMYWFELDLGHEGKWSPVWDKKDLGYILSNSLFQGDNIGKTFEITIKAMP